MGKEIRGRWVKIRKTEKDPITDTDSRPQSICLSGF